MKRYVSDFLFAVLAGVSIALGGTVFLSLDNKVLGALFFCVGLFTVCTFGFHLFTGKVCYVLEKPPAYCGWLVLVWFGNLAGANLVGYLLRTTRLSRRTVSGQDLRQPAVHLSPGHVLQPADFSGCGWLPAQSP